MHTRTYLKTMRGAICCRMNVSRASGVACGSSYGRFCIFIKNKLKPFGAYCATIRNQLWLKPVLSKRSPWPACAPPVPQPVFDPRKLR